MKSRREAELAEIRERDASRTAHLDECCVCGKTLREHIPPTRAPRTA